MKRFFRFLGKCLLAYLLLTLLLVFAWKFTPVPFTPYMVRVKLQEPSLSIQHHWVSMDEISPELVYAVISSEDNLYMKHSGFQWNVIAEQLKKRADGKPLRGGSTISQQTAKNCFTFAYRTWLRKGVETYFTFLIEKIWGKERILEVYLNSIEMGDGIFGCEAAAQTYFHKSAAKLTKKEAALIAACLPNPRKYSVTNPGPYMRKRQQQIVNLMPKMARVEFLEERKHQKKTNKDK
ncbi:MAG: monofunctional biosynthetic peptidoglycan transglycosylase [Bacteroidales bacterium]|nr:monofunctional biosynthetic peptidoglycan transglycosylase [Bacteroidales bacterium]